MCPRDALTPEHAWLSSSTERLFCFHATIRTAFYYFSLAITSAISEPSIISGHPKMSMMPAQLSRTRACVPLSMAAFRSWVAGAKLGERFEYYRGRLGIDRVKGTSSLREPERRKLNAVADYALALAGLGKLHLLQERHRAGDYSHWAVARAPGRSIEQAPDRLPTAGPLNQPRPSPRIVLFRIGRSAKPARVGRRTCWRRYGSPA